MALQEEFEKQGNWLFRYRSHLPLFILVAGALVFVWTELHPENYFIKGSSWEPWYEYFCLLVSLFGLVIRILTVGYTPRGTSGRNIKGQVAETLNTSGIYSVVRHPLYLGNFFMWLGPVLLPAHGWFVIVFCLFYWIYYERIMFAEEQFLRSKFGQDYLDWSKEVPAFFPRFRNFRKSDLNFSWKKVLKKEKNGLAAVFLIFCLLDIAGELMHGRTEFNYVLIGACLFTAVLYLVLKFMKKRTRWLTETGR